MDIGNDREVMSVSELIGRIRGLDMLCLVEKHPETMVITIGSRLQTGEMEWDTAMELAQRYNYTNEPIPWGVE